MLIQCTGEECASILGIDYDTLNNRLKEDTGSGFSDYYAQKSAGGKVSLRRKQYQKAVEEGNPTMLIWLGKQWLGQKDGAEEAVKDSPVGRIEIEVIGASSNDTTD